MMLGKTITLEDMAEVDVETYNSLKWLLANDPECLCLTFSTQEDHYGEVRGLGPGAGGLRLGGLRLGEGDLKSPFCKHI